MFKDDQYTLQIRFDEKIARIYIPNGSMFKTDLACNHQDGLACFHRGRSVDEPSFFFNTALAQGTYASGSLTVTSPTRAQSNSGVQPPIYDSPVRKIEGAGLTPPEGWRLRTMAATAKNTWTSNDYRYSVTSFGSYVEVKSALLNSWDLTNCKIHNTDVSQIVVCASEIIYFKFFINSGSVVSNSAELYFDPRADAL